MHKLKYKKIYAIRTALFQWSPMFINFILRAMSDWTLIG